MQRPTHIDARSAAIARLAAAGRAAMPDASATAEAHLNMVSVALATDRVRADRAPIARGSRRALRRRQVLLGAIAALVAVPSLAVAGVLPDAVQRAVADVAETVGVDLPRPKAEPASGIDRGTSTGDERRGETDRDEAAGAAQDGSNTKDAAPGSAGENGHVNGTKPGKPEDGEQRGNRFGQVPDGPDQGSAGQPRPDQGGPGKPAKAPKPSKPKPAKPKPAKPTTPKPATPTPSTPAPAQPAPATPEPAAPTPPTGSGNSNAGGNGNGNGHGSGSGNGR